MDALEQLIPLMLIWIVWSIILFFIGRRKGVGLIAVIAGSFPLWLVIFATWLVSLTDKTVLERLARLESASPSQRPNLS
jgi:hypothetical protein